MSETLSSILSRLEDLAAYQGPWRPLRDETPRLRERLAELRARESRLDDMLIVALVGGTGVGKSTLLNAIAGDSLARASEFRPCTNVPTVYHPPGAEIAFDGWTAVSGSALEHLIIIDTPDSDTIVKEHREIVAEALSACDLILICGSAEKYLDEATWSLLRPLRGERQMVCVETKATDATASIREHWLGRLREQGFDTAEYFRVGALKALDRKLKGGAEPSAEEFDFPRFENFLRAELSRERIRRIKRSNAAGLLRKTLTQLEEATANHTALDDVERLIRGAEVDVTQAAHELVEQRLFAEPHLWNYALGREISLRAKGFTGTVYRVFETVRSLPVRVAGLMPWARRENAGHQAAALLAGADAFEEDFACVAHETQRLYEIRQSELALALARAGFDMPPENDGYERFSQEAASRVRHVLSGPARERLADWARRITSWPVTLAIDAPPLAFVVFTCSHIVRSYFTAVLLPTAYFLHAAAVLGIIVGGELLLLSLIARAAAWSVRRAAVRDLRIALRGQGAAFLPERAAIAGARDMLEKIASIRKTLE